MKKKMNTWLNTVTKHNYSSVILNTHTQVEKFIDTMKYPSKNTASVLTFINKS